MRIFEKFRLGFKKSANKISEGFKEIIIKKEIDSLKDSIIEEATRMENEETSENNDESNYRDPNINEALDELKNISESIDKLNEKINKQTL